MMRLWAAWAMACVVLECSRRVRKNGGFYNPSRAPNALANASRPFCCCHRVSSGSRRKRIYAAEQHRRPRHTCYATDTACAARNRPNKTARVA